MNELHDGTAASPRGGERGFSLVEVMIAAFLLFLIIGAAASMLSSGQQLLQSTSVSAEGDRIAEQVAGQVAERIRNGALATLLDPKGNPIPDNPGFAVTKAPTVVYDGFQVRPVVGFAGGAVLGKTLWFQAVGDGESLLTNERDDDGDGVWDERRLHVLEFPQVDPVPPALWPNPAQPLDRKLFKDTGFIGARLGIFRPSVASDPVAIKEQPRTVLGALEITRSGNRVRITVGVLRADTTLRNADRSPRVRCFRGTAYVNLYN